MTVWSHLPNAIHIDRVLASVTVHPEEWDDAWDRTGWHGRWHGRMGWILAWDQAWDQAYSQTWDQAWDQLRVQVRGHARGHARGALLALVAYDDSAKYLNMPIDQLKMLYTLTEHPACVLLQTAAMVFAKEKELAQG
jgi:hypothetical protein